MEISLLVRLFGKRMEVRDSIYKEKSVEVAIRVLWSMRTCSLSDYGLSIVPHCMEV